MATYLYRCAEHGVLEMAAPMGTAPPEWVCPHCRGRAARVFTTPRLSLGSPARRALLDSTEKSRDEPAVVSGPPPSRRRPASAHNPALARLPRP